LSQYITSGLEILLTIWKLEIITSNMLCLYGRSNYKSLFNIPRNNCLCHHKTKIGSKF